MPKQQKVTIKAGDKFNKLTAVEPCGKNKHRRRLWVFRCDCGKQVERILGKVRTGILKSCGSKGFCAIRLPDLTGNKYGYLTVISYEAREKQGWFWNCQCVCGKFKLFRTHSLVRKGAKSCGCRKKETRIASSRILPNDLAQKRTRFRYHLTNAKKRGIVNRLSFDDYIEIASRPCYYCGKISDSKNYKTGSHIKLNSVDRLNNEKFYTRLNAVAACFDCQKTKSNLSAADYIEMCRKVTAVWRKQKDSLK